MVSAEKVCRRILRASEEGYTESYIVCPGAVVGPSKGPVPSGSVFFKFMSQFSLAFKKPFYVGEGGGHFYTVRIPLVPFTCPLTHTRYTML